MVSVDASGLAEILKAIVYLVNDNQALRERVIQLAQEAMNGNSEEVPEVRETDAQGEVLS